MFTVAELQPSPCGHQVTLTPFHHVHIVHHGHLVTRVHIVHRGQLGSGPHSPETSSPAPWYRDLQAVAAVFSRLQHHRSPECVHQLLN